MVGDTLLINDLIATIDSDDQMYDKDYFSVLKKEVITEGSGNTGVFKVFTYKNSLRFSVLFIDSPCSDTVDCLLSEIIRFIDEHKKSTCLLWYSQTNGFSNSLLDRLNPTNPYHFYRYHMNRNNMNVDVDIKGLTCRECTEDMIDTCIEALEEVFTPFPDPPGSFLEDKERITSEFLDKSGETLLFFRDDELVGLCRHKRGHITETLVRKKFQGQGYGKVVVRSVLKSIYEMGYDAELTTGSYNERAIALYKAVGFEKVYEAKRVSLL